MHHAHFVELRWGIALILLVVSVGCSPDPTPPAGVVVEPPPPDIQLSLMDQARGRFLTQVAGGIEVKVVESPPRRDGGRAFIKSVLPVDVVAEARSVESRSFSLEGSSPVEGAQLGVVVLGYSDKETTKRIQSALAKGPQIFQGIEALTRFVSITAGDSLLVLYTDTPLNDRVRSFMESAPTLLGDGADAK